MTPPVDRDRPLDACELLVLTLWVGVRDDHAPANALTLARALRTAVVATAHARRLEIENDRLRATIADLITRPGNR